MLRGLRAGCFLALALGVPIDVATSQVTAAQAHKGPGFLPAGFAIRDDDRRSAFVAPDYSGAICCIPGSIPASPAHFCHPGGISLTRLCSEPPPNRASF